MYGIKTADEAMKMVDEQRERLNAACLSSKPSEDLAHAVNELAKWEGFAAALIRVEKHRTYLADNGITGMRAHFALASIIGHSLASGADDKWSGRGNDSKRAWFDGYSTAMDEVLDDLEDQAADLI